MQELLEALAVFTQTPDKVALSRANSWLQDFQHSVNTSLAVTAYLSAAFLTTNTLVLAA